MVVETGVELVEVVCPRCGYHWTRSYEVVHYETASGAVGDYFSAEGLPAASPYAPDGAPRCLRCAWRAVARFIARRSGGSVEIPDRAGPPVAARRACGSARAAARRGDGVAGGQGRRLPGRSWRSADR